MPVASAQLIDNYAAAPSSIKTAIEGLTEAQFLHKSGKDEWSIHEIIVHLADSEAIGYTRIRKTLAEHEPELTVYDEAAWAKQLNYQELDRDLALKLFTTLRSASAALLRTIPPDAWERVGIHAENGRMTIYNLFNIYLEHGEVHRRQIERVKATLA
jgi:hypothetical protein